MPIKLGELLQYGVPSIALSHFEFMTGYNVEPIVASEWELEDAIDRHYGSPRSLEMRRHTEAAGVPGSTGGVGTGLREVLDGPTLSVDDIATIGALSEVDLDSMGDAEADIGKVKPDEEEIDLGNLAKSANASPVVKLTNVILVDSFKRGASDIHIEPYEKDFRVRFRIDGILCNVMALPMRLREPLTQRIKLMAKLNPTQKRLPQDGLIRIRFRVEDRSRDLALRVSVRPTLWGETIVMRLPDKSELILDMTKLGFEAHSLERFRNAINKPRGIVLLTGPQRAGKTNTLIAAVASLNKADVHIMTAGDRVEFSLPGINQIQLDEHMGESTATVLRLFRDLDADVILVDEIRDSETAMSAVTLAPPRCAC